MITEEVSRFVVDLRLGDVPQEAVHVAKRHILDTLGVIVAGIREEAAHIAIKHAALLGALPNPDSRLPAPDSRLPTPDSRLPCTPSS
ncbi:MAG TPA: MmgE/PrpD family protein, partial [Chloroflexota bacterium]